jgi:hypothetical protein
MDLITVEAVERAVNSFMPAMKAHPLEMGQ